jgi:hypothetical protein
LLLVPHMLMIRVGLGAIILFLVHLVSVYTSPTAMYQTCNTSFVLSCKNAEVVARKLESKCKGDKTCIWVAKVIVTNLVGPNKSWVPKTQA